MVGSLSEFSLFYVCQVYFFSLLNSIFISAVCLVLLHSKYLSKLKIMLTYDPKLLSGTQISKYTYQIEQSVLNCTLPQYCAEQIATL